MPGQRYEVPDEESDLEHRRLAALAQARDPRTIEWLDRVGVSEGMRVLEVGAGTGSVSAWMAERVGPSGKVMSTDIDLRFHAKMPSNVIVRRHDVTRDPLPENHFDVIHARALLQHIPERVDVMDRMVQALRPGGALVIEDGAMLDFAEQTLPEPYGSIHRMIAGASQDEWRDPQAGVRVLGWMRSMGLTDVEAHGDVWIMRPGEPGGEWWLLALRRAVPMLVKAGAVDPSDGEAALAQVRSPEFVMLSPTSIATIGRKPRPPIAD